MNITVKQLGKILHEEFERDSWGLVSPDSFKDPLKADPDACPDDDCGLYEVLERVVDRLNKLK